MFSNAMSKEKPVLNLLVVCYFRYLSQAAAKGLQQGLSAKPKKKAKAKKSEKDEDGTNP